jgi:glyoxylase-like metal-dependent hydrolase (beta-lactamase superfamily II)
MYIKQFEESGFMVFSYLVGCGKTKEALVIDPAGDIDAIIAEADKEGFRILRILNTHGHVDHIMGNAELKKKTNASITVHEGDAEIMVAVPPLKLQLFNAKASPPPDATVKDNDIIAVGEERLRVVHTPGHTPGSICLHLDGYLFTGDTLFVEGVGRTDLPGGSWPQLFNSITKKVLSFPEDTIIMPGHNYGPQPSSTVGDEKRNNPYIQEGY